MEENNTNFDFGKTKMRGDGNNPEFMKAVKREQHFRWIYKYIYIGIPIAGVIISFCTGDAEQALQWVKLVFSRG